MEECVSCYEIFDSNKEERIDFYLDEYSCDDLVEAAVEYGRHEYRRAWFSYLNEANEGL